jgi:hypothetical protein
MDEMNWLANWYASNCNGDWEHSYGVLIQTIDNPGWSIIIDLIDTPLEGRELNELLIDKSEDDWLRVSSDGKRFKGYGDGSKLPLLIENFKVFAHS